MSRRFKGRHAKVQADPAALPGPPRVLDDSNSDRDPLQPDRRIAREKNVRHFARATAAADQAKVMRAVKAAPAAKVVAAAAAQQQQDGQHDQQGTDNRFHEGISNGT